MEEGNRKKAVIKLSGMTCTSCAANVKRSLRKTPGIIDANVNLLNSQVHLEYVPSIVSRPRIGKAIQEAGYDVVHDTIGG